MKLFCTDKGDARQPPRWACAVYAKGHRIIGTGSRVPYCPLDVCTLNQIELLMLLIDRHCQCDREQTNMSIANRNL